MGFVSGFIENGAYWRFRPSRINIGSSIGFSIKPTTSEYFK
jgi:hypothetical protein